MQKRGVRLDMEADPEDRCQEEGERERETKGKVEMIKM